MAAAVPGDASVDAIASGIGILAANVGRLGQELAETRAELSVAGMYLNCTSIHHFPDHVAVADREKSQAALARLRYNDWSAVEAANEIRRASLPRKPDV